VQRNKTMYWFWRDSNNPLSFPLLINRPTADPSAHRKLLGSQRERRALHRGVDSLMCELLMRSALCIQRVREELFLFHLRCAGAPLVTRATPEGTTSEHTHTADRAAVIRISINHEEWSGHMPQASRRERSATVITKKILLKKKSFYIF